MEGEGTRKVQVGKKAGIDQMKEVAMKRQGASTKRKKGPERKEEEEKENAGKRRKRSVKEKGKPR